MGTLRLPEEGNQASNVQLERTDDTLAGKAKDVAALIDQLEAQADELDLQASNANRILSVALMTFLASESGCEFGSSLRLCTYQRFRVTSEQTEELRKELQALEEQLTARRNVFAFMESLISRLQHRVGLDS